MATPSSILAWRIPWTEEPGGPQSMGLQRVGHNWPTKHTLLSRLSCCYYYSKATHKCWGQFSCPQISLSRFGSCFLCPSSLRIFFFFFLGHLSHGILDPWLGSNLGPWEWKQRILTTRPPGNSLFFCTLNTSVDLLNKRLCWVPIPFLGIINYDSKSDGVIFSFIS